jgi:hypothetical protein
MHLSVLISVLNAMQASSEEDLLVYIDVEVNGQNGDHYHVSSLLEGVIFKPGTLILQGTEPNT